MIEYHLGLKSEFLAPTAVMTRPRQRYIPAVSRAGATVSGTRFLDEIG